MTRNKIYLILQTVLCIVLIVLLSVSAVTIYCEGAARKAEHPLESIYTREIAAERFAPVAPLFFASIGLMIVGLVLGIKDDHADKPVKDSELGRDRIVAHVAEPSEAMRSAQRKQKLLQLAGWGAFAISMLPILLYVTNPAHFAMEDLEGMFLSLIRVVIPWTAVGLGALAVTSFLSEKYVLAETEAAQDRIKEEKELGIRPEPETASKPTSMQPLQIVLVIAAICLIIAGIFNGSARDVLYKAIKICTECVGLG